MARYSGTLRDQNLKPIVGAQVSVVSTIDGAVATLTADGGGALSNPFKSDIYGSVVFNVDGGFYDISYYFGGRSVGADRNVNIGGGALLPDGSVANSLGSSTTIAPSQFAVSAAIPTTTASQPGSGNFYAGSGAKINRYNDRAFFGAATANLGTNAGSQPDWLTTYLISKGRTFGFQQIATVAVLSQNNSAGQNAFVAGARTSELTAAGNSIGVLGVGVNDNPTYSTGAWGGYFEGFQNSGALGPAYGAEMDVVNFNGVAVTNPYSQAPTQVVGLQLGAGAEFSGTSDASAAVNVQGNGAKFNVGINFGATSLTGTNGDGTGTATALQFARGHALKWFSASNNVTTQIFSVSASTNASTTVVFEEGVTSFKNSGTGKGVLDIGNIGASGVNRLRLNNSAAASPTQILSLGDDTNIDIQISPKGTGAIWLGPWSSGGDAAITGYVAVKDSTGNVRKLATIA